MHDIDRTHVGSGYEFETDCCPSGESEYTGDREMELAADLMELNSEEEFENFLGELISNAAKATGGHTQLETGQSLGALKGAARHILPIIDQAAGGPAPAGSGRGIRVRAGQSYLFETEMEEREWEAAKTFVNLAQEAAVNAAQAPPEADPAVVANKAVTDSAKEHAPRFGGAAVPRADGDACRRRLRRGMGGPARGRCWTMDPPRQPDRPARSMRPYGRRPSRRGCWSRKRARF